MAFDLIVNQNTTSIKVKVIARWNHRAISPHSSLDGGCGNAIMYKLPSGNMIIKNDIYSWSGSSRDEKGARQMVILIQDTLILHSQDDIRNLFDNCNISGAKTR